MFNVLPNTGIMSNDELDKLRVAALQEHFRNPLPSAVLAYIIELEQAHIRRVHDGKLKSSLAIWNQQPPSDDDDD